MPAFTSRGDLCPSCGGTRLRSFTARAYDSKNKQGVVSVVECISCQFAWQWPASRTAEESAAYFAEMYGEAAAGSYFDAKWKLALSELELEYLTFLVGRPGAILDLGCGAGEFVRLAGEHGWHAIGVDPATPSARLNDHAEIVRGTLDAVERTLRFDAVTLWDVIEHLDDPRPVIAAVKQRMAPGGFIVIETGNYQSAGRIRDGSDWWSFQHDHRWYFSPNVVAELVAQAGFKDIQVHPKVLRPGWSGRAAYAGPSAFEHLKAAIRRPWRAPALLARFNALQKARDQWPAWSGLDIFSLSARA